MRIDWPEKLLEHESAAVERDGDVELFRGMRMSMAVHAGQPRYETHPMTNRLDFFGDVCEAAALVESLARPGQVLVTNTAFACVVSSVDCVLV